MEYAAPFLILAVCFAVLAKSADLFVDSAVGIAKKFSVPKMIIGIFLVGLATTAPELAVSMMSAVRGNPELALGNAIGSVICDDGLAMAAAALFTAGTISIIPAVLKTAGVVLIAVDILAFLFILPDNTLGRVEGGILLACFGLYTLFIIKTGKKTTDALIPDAEIKDIEQDIKGKPIHVLVVMFLLGLTGIIGSSHFIIESAVKIAEMFHIPETVIALTLIALGTSIPEVATCIIAARKGHGEIAVGNIIGADILNICWVAGASAVANPLTVGRKEIIFMFPAMFVIVGAMLLMIRTGYRLKRIHGFMLLSLYIVYIILTIFFFPPGSGALPTP